MRPVSLSTITPSVAVSRIASSSCDAAVLGWSAAAIRRLGGPADHQQSSLARRPFSRRGRTVTAMFSLLRVVSARAGPPRPIPESGRAAEQVHETAIGADLVDIVIAGEIEQEAVGEQDVLAAMDEDADGQPVENLVAGTRRSGAGSSVAPGASGSSASSRSRDGAFSFAMAKAGTDRTVLRPPHLSRRAPKARAISRKAWRSAFERLEAGAAAWAAGCFRCGCPGVAASRLRGREGFCHADRADSRTSSLPPRERLAPFGLRLLRGRGRAASVRRSERIEGCPSSCTRTSASAILMIVFGEALRGLGQLVALGGVRCSVPLARSSIRRRPKPRKPMSSRSAPKTAMPAQVDGHLLRGIVEGPENRAPAPGLPRCGIRAATPPSGSSTNDRESSSHVRPTIWPPRGPTLWARPGETCVKRHSGIGLPDETDRACAASA